MPTAVQLLFHWIFGIFRTAINLDINKVSGEVSLVTLTVTVFFPILFGYIGMLINVSIGVMCCLLHRTIWMFAV